MVSKEMDLSSLLCTKEGDWGLGGVLLSASSWTPHHVLWVFWDK